MFTAASESLEVSKNLDPSFEFLIAEAKARGAALIGIFHDTEIRDQVADRLFEVLPIQDAA